MTMAGLAGLEMCSKALKVSTEFPENLSGKSLLQKYLDGVETKLHSHLKRLNNSSLFDGKNDILTVSHVLQAGMQIQFLLFQVS